MKIAWFLVLGLFVSDIASAAPHPLTGSSIINSPGNALAFAQMGFKISGIPDYWRYAKSIESKAQMLEIGTDKKTLLSFRVDRVSAKVQVESYVRQYLRDYNQYGLEVTGLQSFKRNDTPSVIVDLSQKNKTTKSRQIFFHKNNSMVIATCTDETATFDMTLKICNQIFASFQWK